MFMQDNPRATLVGTRTDGGGGNVLSFDATVYSEAPTRVTLGPIPRAQPVATPGFAASPSYDGVGIYQDIVLDHRSADNLLNKGQRFVEYFSIAMANIIQKARAQ